jgi:HisJ family histidinol phosphate phosphatase
MIDYDLHIHTEFCGHAPGMTVEAIVTRADELGLDTIAITDHIFAPTGLPLLTAIRAELSRTPHRCRVIIGAEIDVDGDYGDGRLVTDELDAVEYVVAGFHYVPTVGNYPHSPDDCTMPAAEFLKLWRTALLGIVSNPKVHTLAHPARLVASAVNLDHWFDEVLMTLAEAAKLSAKNTIAWEINELTGTRLSDYYRNRWHLIYKIALDAGVKLVFGSDAHSPEAIGQSAFAEFVLAHLPRRCLTTPDEFFAAR